MLQSDARMLHVGKHSAKWLLLNCIGSTSQWRIVGSRGSGARTSVGPSAMVRPNVYQLGGAGSPPAGSGPGRVIFFPINAPGMGRFQLLNLAVFGYVLELRFWVVIAIIVSLTLTITLITTLTII